MRIRLNIVRHMKRNSSDIPRPSRDEFRNTVESLFGFLCAEYGYVSHWDNEDHFSVEYTKEPLVIRVYGSGWGAYGHVIMMIGEEHLPYHQITAPGNRRLTQSTGKPQLDDLSELAYRIRNECKDILSGDLSRLSDWRKWKAEQEQKVRDFSQRHETERFFAKAEELWQPRRFSALVQYLHACESQLNPLWRRRYRYAQKHA